jgi:cysteine sulfinate desulfinase/cysteine desulfurase-like protein
LYEKIDVAKLGVDFLTLDGIKMYGPRGVGILFQKLGVPMLPLFFGGGQERGLRSGTENLPAIIGLAKAFELADKMRQSESARLREIRDYAIEKILKNFSNAKLNGSRTQRLPNNINICFLGSDSEFLVVALDVEGIALSHSSTCRTLKEDSSSYVVEALGQMENGTESRKDGLNAKAILAPGRQLPKLTGLSQHVPIVPMSDCSRSSLRITLGRGTTKKDIDALVVALNRVINLV